MIPKRYFDINKFPKTWGIIVFPISMSRIGNSLAPQKIINALHLFREKILTNQVGANCIYSEGLYMNFEHDASVTKNNFAKASVGHMLGIRKLVLKNFKSFQISSAFSFESWFQMYLSHKDFFKALKMTEELYKTDKEFRRLVALDTKSQGKKLNKRQIAFFLEEHTFMYLLINRQLRLRNDFVGGREEWVLLAYPERPPRAQIYLIQKDPLGINGDGNPYKGQYVMNEKVFIDYLKTDLTEYQPTASRT